MKYIILSFSIIFFSCSIQKIPITERVEIQYFLTTDEFKSNAPSELVYTKIKEIGTDFIRVHGFFDKRTNEKIKKANSSWALKYNDIDYINMRYCDDYQNSELYAKYDIKGKICALFINDDTSQKIKSGGINYGGGLLGVMMKNSGKWGKNWKDSNGKKNKIMINNTNIVDTKCRTNNKNSKAKLLTKKNFNTLLGSEYSKEKIKEFSFEDVVKIINEINAAK